MKHSLRSPALRLGAAGLLTLVVLAFVGWCASTPPWLGLRMKWEGQGARVLVSEGPARAVPAGTLLVAIDDITLRAEDFTEEPDASITSYRGYAAFIARQAQLYAALQGTPTFVDARGLKFTIDPAPSRPLSSLPHEYWIQVLVGCFAFLISAGVWAFRSELASARYLLLSGFSTLVFAPFAGVYSTRELALDGTLFRWLSDANFAGGCIYCATMVAVLWHYPRALSGARASVWVVLAFAAWWSAQQLGMFESMVVARRYPVFAAVLATFALSFVQWRATRSDPVARAALSWFLLSWLLGSCTFAAITMVPQLFGVNTAALQGYGFSLFLLVYGGLAFGILRFRLFDLGLWWFRAFTWLAGALLLFGADLALAAAFALSEVQSLGLALLVCGFVWLPLRSFAWSKLGTRRTHEPDLFKRVIQISFAPDLDARCHAWHALGRALFAPLQLEPLAQAPQAVELRDDGLRLCVPAIGTSSGFVMAYAAAGRRLFTPRDCALMQQAVGMLQYIDESREAYSQGAREERTRIARDLHDDIGSRLLTGLHQPRIEQTKASISQALAEMRSIIHGLSGSELTLEHAVAELRHEALTRADAAGIELEWPLVTLGSQPLGYRGYKHLLSIQRELLSNVLRHAQASTLRVALRIEGGRLVSELHDDGVGFDAENARGRGLPNIRERVSELAGTLSYLPSERGTHVRICLSLDALATLDAVSAPGAVAASAS